MADLTVAISKEPTYLHAVVTGRYSLEGAGRLLLQALDACAREDMEKLFVDCTAVEGPYTTMERYTFSQIVTQEYLNRYTAKGRRPVLCVVLGKEPLVDPKRFGENVLRNRGVSTYRVTTDREEAMEWLGAGEKKG
jgi:hypothetical protein